MRRPAGTTGADVDAAPRDTGAVRAQAASSPGAVLPAPGDRPPGQPDVVHVVVQNTAGVPISVTSHFHVFEVNPRLRFHRAAAFGRRLGVPAGTDVLTWSSAASRPR